MLDAPLMGNKVVKHGRSQKSSQCVATLYQHFAAGHPKNADGSLKTGSQACLGSVHVDPVTQQCITGDTESFNTLGNHKVVGTNGSGQLGFHVSSIRVAGESGCQVRAFRDEACAGTAMGIPATPSTQLSPDSISNVYDAGVVTPGGNLQSTLGWDNDQTKCITISCGDGAIPPPTPPPTQCVVDSLGSMYATAGSSSWSGMDMGGQGRTVEADASACQARCAGVAGCAYFTFWSGDGGCHLQDSNAELRQSPGSYPTQYGPGSCPTSAAA